MPENIPIFVDAEPASPHPTQVQEPFPVFFRRAFRMAMPDAGDLNQFENLLDYARDRRYMSGNRIIHSDHDGYDLRLGFSDTISSDRYIVLGRVPGVSETITSPTTLNRLPALNTDRDWVPLEIEGVCDVCGEHHDENYHHQHSGGIICEDCIHNLREDNPVCKDCGAILTGSKKLFNTPDGEYCCECAESAASNNDWVQCERCDRYAHRDDMRDVNNGEKWCVICRDGHAISCDDCGEYYSELHDVHSASGRRRSVCDGCRDSNYSECQGCGDYYHNDGLDEDGNCSGCSDRNDRRRSEEEPFGSARAGYHSTPRTWHRHQKGTAPAFFGLEIETEGGEEVEWTRYDDIPGLKHWIATKDGSLDETGIEFVSPALPLSEWEAEGKAFQKMADNNDRQAWKRESCGLHVHMSVDHTTIGDELQKELLRPFWPDFRRAPTETEFLEGKAFVRWLGRRYSDSYAHFPKERYLDDRYLCVGRLSDHVEFRIFRSTTNAASIRGIVGVCNAWQKAAHENYESMEQWFKSFVDHCTLDKHALQYLERCCETTKNQWATRYRSLVPQETKQPEEEAACA